jgi:dTDP-4-dehydrorhamnose 3,5-epimerase
VLADDTEVSYAMGAPYAPEHQSGVRHDDPRLGIEWPLAVGTVSERDRRLPTLAEATDLIRRMTESR